MRGKAGQCVCCRRGKWDHPRLCGEKEPVPAFSHSLLGSPPPMRGKALRMEVEARERRITPAYAGKR